MRDGGLSVVAVEGEAGIGKTRLVAEALDHFGGFEIVRGAGDEFERDRPFAPFVAALGLDARSPDPDRAAIGGLISRAAPGRVPGLPGSVAEVRYLVVDALAELLATRAREHPLALVLEDLHWADTSTLIAVRAIVRRLTGLPALVVLTMRPEYAQRPELDLLLARLEPLVEHVRLEPLSDPDVATLVALLAGGEPGPHLLRLVHGASGNPLFIGELVAQLDDEQRLSHEHRVVDVDSAELPQTFPRTVLRRVASLSPGSAAMLRVAAVLGSHFTLDDLVALSERPTAEVAAAVREALLAAILRGDGSELEFRHALVRLAVYEDIPPPLRAGLHRAAGRVLAARRAAPARIAFHFEAAATPADDNAIDWLVRAADSARSNAPEAAADLLGRAATIAGPGHPRLVEIETALTEALLGSGRNARRAEEIARRHLGHAPPDLRDTLWRNLATALILQNRPAEAIEVLETAASGASNDTERARFEVEVALAALLAGDNRGAATAAARAEAMGRAAGDPAAVAIALVVRGRAVSSDLAFDEALRLCHEGVEAAATDPSGLAARVHPQFFEGLVLHDADRLDDLEQSIALGLARCEQQGAVWPRPLYHALAAFGHYRAGALADAETSAEASLVAADESGMMLATLWAHSLLALVALHRGDLDRAGEAVTAAQAAQAETNTLLGADLLVVADARLRVSRGDTDGALALLALAWEAVGARELRAMQLVFAPELLPLALAAGRADLAGEVVDTLARAASATTLPSHVGAARWARGLAAGDSDELLDAVEAYRSSPRVLERAAVTVDAALALHAVGRRAEAIALADETLDTYRALGAEGDATAAYRCLRPVLPRGRRPPATHRPVSGWESLTPTERAVAECVAAGATNKEVSERLGMSPRTVETHLSRIYAKLAVSSRVKLAVEAGKRR